MLVIPRVTQLPGCSGRRGSFGGRGRLHGEFGFKNLGSNESLVEGEAAAEEFADGGDDGHCREPCFEDCRARASSRSMPGKVGVNGCMSLPQLGKENLLAELTRLLTVIRGSAILCFARTREGFRGGDVPGAFFLLPILLRCVSS